MSSPNERARAALRVDLLFVADLIEPGSRVLDIGCADGALLHYLISERGVDGRGIEISQTGVNACVGHGLSVIQGNADTDLEDYPDGAFDYVVLSRTQAGNWIYSTGGNLMAAKANGVPTNKVKIALFVFSAFCATIFAACQVFEVNTADAARGNLKELEAIAAAVIGGIVMTGGFGTVLGIIVGAFIFGLAKEAFFYIPGIDGSFYRIFLGLVIIASALLNENIRKRIMGAL